ncbi:transposase domain-containing protein [Sorangium sp. So ce861]|uniref:transposase domain-containing protein n=1 Tax=Sorangium sp. So ce861 TaxID=3133323 RepID=UPI003F61EF49
MGRVRRPACCFGASALRKNPRRRYGWTRADASGATGWCAGTRAVTPERLRRHIFGQKAEHADPGQMQLAFDAIVQMLAAAAAPPPRVREVAAAASPLRHRFAGAPPAHAGVTGPALLWPRFGIPQSGLAAVAGALRSLSHRTASLCPWPARRQDGLYRTHTSYVMSGPRHQAARPTDVTSMPIARAMLT